MKDEPGRDVDDWSSSKKTTRELHSNNMCVFRETTGWRSEATFSLFLTAEEFTQFDEDLRKRDVLIDDSRETHFCSAHLNSKSTEELKEKKVQHETLCWFTAVYEMGVTSL